MQVHTHQFSATRTFVQHFHEQVFALPLSVMLDAESRGDRQEQIVAEHMLHVRLARISSNATWAAGLMGLLGAIAGVFLSK